MRLVDQDGTQIGIVSTQEALARAQAQDLDLVEVAPTANPPVCRIMDYGKFKYERDVRLKEARKKQSRVEVKEIKMRPKIDPHDYGIKRRHVERFLHDGARVKVTIMFRGREMAHTELGRKLLDRLTDDLKELGTVDTYPKLDGRNMTMLFAPTKRQPVKAEDAHDSDGSDQEQPTASAAATSPTSGPGPEPEVAPAPASGATDDEGA